MPQPVHIDSYVDHFGATATTWLKQLKSLPFRTTTAPSFTSSIPEDYTIECDELQIVYEDAAATDNCSGGASVVPWKRKPWQVTVHSTTSSFATSLRDRQLGQPQRKRCRPSLFKTRPAPILTIPADYTVECDDSMPMADASATDNCGQVNIEEVQEVIQGDCAGTHTITRAFTATDECGNSTSATQTITARHDSS